MEKTQEEIFADILAAAKKHSGQKYVFGGNGGGGIDCSAFTKAVFKDGRGIDIPRTANGQYQMSKKVSKQEVQPGDLAFLKASQNKAGATHAAIFLGWNPDGSAKIAESSRSSGSTIDNVWKLQNPKSYHSLHLLGFGRIE